MKQIIQDLRNGETILIEVPSPKISPRNVLVHTNATLISPGTERMLTNFGKASYFQKARQQPEKVKEVVAKVKTDGLFATYEAVQNKLSNPIPLGYSNVGVVVEVGSEVQDLVIGDRVVSNGSHSEVVSVPKNLCARIPKSVSNDQASFVVLGAIGLQGIRLANPTLGECVIVFGLGVIGLMTVQILQAQGCRVLAFDIKDDRLKLANNFGASIANSNKEDIFIAAQKFSRGRGVDSVIITANTKHHDITSHAAKMCRKRGRIVLVGETGLNLNRSEFYEKELSFQVSCSYGPGRYDPQYEEEGNDYPIAFVRWTEQRNFEAVLDLMEAKKIDIEPLISQKIPFEQAPEIYTKMKEDTHLLGLILLYSSPQIERNKRTIRLPEPEIAKWSNNSVPNVSFIGAGNYSSRVLIPAFKAEGANLNTVVTQRGLRGSIFGGRAGFKYSSTDIDEVIRSPFNDTIVIATRHNSHADLVCRSIRAGKNVFVEKPLTIDVDGLDEIIDVCSVAKDNLSDKSEPQLMVGFNRRFSPHIVKMKSLLSKVEEPKSFIMTMNAGSVPKNHWVHDSKIGGGRIVGEACHYIDLMLFLSGSKITSVNARSMGPSSVGKTNDDNATITLGFEDGSFGTINYLSVGSKSYRKEFIEVFCSGGVLTLDNFKTLKGYDWFKFKVYRTLRQNKGQRECVGAFLGGLRTNTPPIPSDELFEVSRVSLEVAKQLGNQV